MTFTKPKVMSLSGKGINEEVNWPCSWIMNISGVNDLPFIGETLTRS